MDALFFHPKLVHVPMALGVLMPILAIGLLIAWWRGALPQRAWYIAIALQAVLFGAGVLALRSGEVEEDRVERVVPEAAIEAHEEAAAQFVWASGAVLAAMVVAGGLGARRSARLVAAGATVGTLVVLGLGYRVGQAGGELVYRHGAALAYVNGGAPGGAGGAAAMPAPARGGDDDD